MVVQVFGCLRVGHEGLGEWVSIARQGDVQLRLDALSRRDGQQTLSYTGREARHRRARAGHLAFRVGEQPLVLVERDESYLPSDVSSTGCSIPRPFPGRPSAERDKDKEQQMDEHVRMPALAELPMMSVVHPAYHCGPNGGQGSFLPSASRRLSCVLVLATAPGGGDAPSRQLLFPIVSCSIQVTVSIAHPLTGWECPDRRAATREGATMGGLDEAYIRQDM